MARGRFAQGAVDQEDNEGSLLSAAISSEMPRNSLDNVVLVRGG